MRLYFVLHKTDAGQAICGEYATESDAKEHYRRLVALGWPSTHSASIYTADSRRQLEDSLAKRVQLVCVGIGAGYWESSEGLEQRRLASESHVEDIA